MKKKSLLLLTVLVILLLSTVALATMQNNEQQKILTNEKLSSVGEAYTEINQGISTMDLREENETLELAIKYVNDLEITDLIFTDANSQITKYNNALYTRKETVISNEKGLITIDSDTQELITYVNNKTEFVKGEYDENTVTEKAINIFNKIGQVNVEEYELVYVEKFDDEIWRAGFAKKYGNLINNGESVKFSFCPENNEIVSFAINRLDYANNDVTISMETARDIADSYLAKSKATDMNISLQIVRPNYFYNELQGDESIYVKIDEARTAYVASFNNEAKSEVYIDATTGEVIGGNMILGGEY